MHGILSRRLRVLAFLLLGANAQAETLDYVLDPTHSFVTFEVVHFGTSTLRGRFGPLTGQVRLDRATRSGRVQVVVDTRAVSTGLPVLDERLKAPDLLGAEAFPQAFFVAERFVMDDNGRVGAVRGELTLKGTGRALELVAQRFNCYLHPLLRREVCGGDFEGELRRGDFGISFGLPLVADRVRLLVQVEAIRQSP